MDRRNTLGDIIVTTENVIPVVQQHEEMLPHIKEKVDTLYKMNWVIILLLVAFFGDKGLTYIGKFL